MSNIQYLVLFDRVEISDQYDETAHSTDYLFFDDIESIKAWINCSIRNVARDKGTTTSMGYKIAAENNAIYNPAYIQEVYIVDTEDEEKNLTEYFSKYQDTKFIEEKEKSRLNIPEFKSNENEYQTYLYLKNKYEGNSNV